MANTKILLACLFAALAGSAAKADISITPRFGAYFDNNEQRQSGVGNVQTSGGALDSLNGQVRALLGPGATFTAEQGANAGAANQILFPLYGGSVTIGGSRTQFTLTALYGRAKGHLRTVLQSTLSLDALGFTATDLLSTVTEGNVRYKRFDVEFTAQHRLSETFALIGGIRYERVTGRGTLAGSTTSSSNVANLLSLLAGSGDIDLGLGTDRQEFNVHSGGATYSVRAGAAAFVPVSHAILAYVNGLLHVSLEPRNTGHVSLTDQAGTVLTSDVVTPSETALGPDLSVGMLIRFSNRMALDVRYRGIFYFPVSGPRSFDDPRVNHGITIGFTYAFGR